MKKYYSLQAKVLLFVAAIICGFVTVMSAGVGAVLLAEGLYDENESTFVEEHLENCLYDVDDILWELNSTTPDTDSNLVYRVFDEEGKVIKEFGDPNQELLGNYAYVYRKSDYSVDCLYRESNSDLLWTTKNAIPEQVIEDHYQKTVDEFFGTTTTDSELYLIQLGVKKNMTAKDETYWNLQLIHWIFACRHVAPILFGIGLILTLVCFGYLLAGAGHHRGSEELFPGPLDRIPVDLLACGYGVVMVFCGIGAAESLSSMDFSTADSFLSRLIGLGLIFSLCVIVAGSSTLGMCLTIASRFKRRALLKNSIVWRALCLLGKWGRGAVNLCRQGLHVVPMMWKVLLVFFVVSFLEFVGLCIFLMDESIMPIWFFEKILMLAGIIWFTAMLQKLKVGGEALAKGDLNYKTDTSRMILDLKEHGENLNSIAQGMNAAVYEKLKSERMKTELITNVSHDIKTPLTSIINYATLIAEQPTEDEQVKEYTQVLVRQSDKLKRLIEDLVEASKASTGNLEVELMPCDAAVFVEQAGGEYAEKLARADLTLIPTVPEEEITIMADGRRMWRVFDNLMNNICKYSLTGSRVYLTLEKKGDQAVFTFRNVSREALNISPEELMERFVRGDSSRHTEGNGLGLSIARSMTELQGGTLDLSIDGDLFKAILTFPIVG